MNELSSRGHAVFRGRFYGGRHEDLERRHGVSIELLHAGRAWSRTETPSVLMVLEEVMERRRPSAGTWGVLAAMGPGFCAELVLLRW
jgi:alkylresorcinol/alkylpyrone synthase